MLGWSAPLISRVIGEFVKITPRVLSTWSHAMPDHHPGQTIIGTTFALLSAEWVLRGCDAMTGSPPDDLVCTGKSRNTTSQQQKVRSYCNGTVCPVKLKSCAQRVIAAPKAAFHWFVRMMWPSPHSSVHLNSRGLLDGIQYLIDRNIFD